MHTVYRLYVERKALPTLEALVSGAFDGYTLIWSTGFWRGLRESSVIVEIVTDDSADSRGKIYDLAESLRVALEQSAVLVTEQPVASVLIVAKDNA